VSAGFVKSGTGATDLIMQKVRQAVG